MTPNPWNLGADPCRVLLALIEHGIDKIVMRELKISRTKLAEELRAARVAMGVRSRLQAAVHFDRWHRAQKDHAA